MASLTFKAGRFQVLDELVLKLGPNATHGGRVFLGQTCQPNKSNSFCKRVEWIFTAQTYPIAAAPR